MCEREKLNLQIPTSVTAHHLPFTRHNYHDYYRSPPTAQRRRRHSRDTTTATTAAHRSPPSATHEIQLPRTTASPLTAQRCLRHDCSRTFSALVVHAPSGRWREKVAYGTPAESPSNPPCCPIPSIYAWTGRQQARRVRIGEKWDTSGLDEGGALKNGSLCIIVSPVLGGFCTRHLEFYGA